MSWHTISSIQAATRAIPLLLALLLLAAGNSAAGETLACQRVYFGDQSLDNIACRCNATHCDDGLEFEWPSENDASFVRVLSSKAGARFERASLHPVAGANGAAAAADYVLEVQVNKRHQQVVGFGGAFTDSASQLLGTGLAGEMSERALADYFGPRGLQYNLGRVPIGGTDMSWRAYSYDDLPAGAEPDLELRHFALQPEDLVHKIPLIKRANALRAGQQLEPLKLMAASWSAPSWMKSNQHLVQGKLRGNSSSGPYYDAYARYQIRFVHEYERAHNLSIWALSPQNEPHSPKRVGPAIINFNSVNFEPEEMADYLAGSLVPNLIKAGKSADKLKLFIWDDTLEGLDGYQQAALRSADVSNYTLGLAIHWYATGLNGQPYRLLFEARRKLPPKYSMISTEACFIGRPRPGEWWRGERYARDLIENLRAGSVGWIDWNLALNMSGGPTWSNNLLDAAMLVDPAEQAYYKNPMYYALGHVSRFIRPEAHIVHSQVLAAADAAGEPASGGDEIAAVAAELSEPILSAKGPHKTLKRRLAVVVLNSAKGLRRVRLALKECHLKRNDPALELELPASSVTSLAFVC